jgi:hypothetical protein
MGESHLQVTVITSHPLCNRLDASEWIWFVSAEQPEMI